MENLKKEIMELQLKESLNKGLNQQDLLLLRSKVHELNVTLAWLETWWNPRAKTRWIQEDMECNNVCFIVLKYGGYWTEVKGQSRMKYVGGSRDGNRAEVVVVVKDHQEDMTYTDETQYGDMQDLSAKYTLNNDILVDGLCDGSFAVEVEEKKDLCIGSRFEDSSSFKQAIRSNAILQNFAIKIKASDKSRVIATCTYRGCPWRIRASLCSDGHSFEVKKLHAIHLCPGVNRAGNKQATSAWIAHEIKDIVKRNPDITPKDIGNNLETTFGVSLPYMKIWRSRELARNQIFGSIDDNYKWVPTLQFELLNRNPGSHIAYQCDKQNNSFKRFFVSFKVCIDGFFAGCRYLIGIDACHLKSKYLGVLLSANCLDGNNGLFNIAFAVAESESKRSWEWFLVNLVHAFNADIEHLAFISDMEKGLGEAIKTVFPNAEHRVCMRHLWKNIKKLFRCDDSHNLQKVVWTAANCFSLHEFNSKLQQIFNISPQVHSYLTSLTCKWSKATFSIHIKNHYNTNNMAESFNAWVEDARSKPVVDLIDTIRGMLMEQRSHRKSNSVSWNKPLVPCVEEYIREVTTKKEVFIIRQSTTTKAEVEGVSERQEVDIESHTCTCGFWQISGLPCVHVAAFVGTKNNNLWHTYVDEKYYNYRYRMAYEGAISTLPGKEQWSIISDNQFVFPPVSLRPRGRPKKRRIKNFLEGGQKTKSIHKCGRCNSWGHHRNTCKEPLHFEEGNIQDTVSEKMPIRRGESF
ncbi:uncharacterized protein LOC110095035 [Dendrobium catenatum]|uniref:uncharacterized protein LOC110095035 n=1 Tax=Dendrobium catenatum TaxID=906689 RepID=UPI0009F73FB4|nr:uncharacterized protein LOC110095035 [Dendrobium catenatum]